MNRIILVFSVFMLCLPQLAHADDASKHAKIEEMLRVTKMDETMSKLMEQTKGEISDMVAEQRAGANNLPPAQAKVMNDFETKISELMIGTLSLTDIHPIMVKIYDETYSEAELDGILAFYKTPAGQALLTKTPDLMDKVMGTVQQRISELGPQVEKLTADMQKQMAGVQPAAVSDAPASTPAKAPAPKQ